MVKRKYNTEEEVWKDIKNYEGRYQVSNWGRVKSLERIVICGNHGSKRLFKEIIKKTGHIKDGYEVVILCKQGEPHNFFVHKLVWETFVGEIPEGLEIDHIIPIKNGGTNKLSNLRCVTHPENCRNPISVDNYKRSHTPENNGGKKVLQYTLDGELINEFPCLSYAARHVGGSAANISACCHRRQKTSYGFVWRLK